MRRQIFRDGLNEDIRDFSKGLGGEGLVYFLNIINYNKFIFNLYKFLMYLLVSANIFLPSRNEAWEPLYPLITLLTRFLI